MKKILLTSAALVACLSLYAVSYKNNTYQKLADEYSQKAQDAIDAGEYELSIEYSKKVEENSALSKAYVQKMIARDEAVDVMKKASSRIEIAKRVGDKIDREVLYSAEKAYSSAASNFALDTEEGYKSASKDAQQVIDILAPIEGVMKIAEVEVARENALAANADKRYPDYFKAFDAEKDAAVAKFEKDSEDTSKKPNLAVLNGLVAKYNSVETASKATDLKEQLSPLSSSASLAYEFKRAATELDKYSKLGTKASGATLNSQAEKAYKLYSSLLVNGYPELVKQEKVNVADAKKLAEGENAQVYTSTRDSYKESAELYWNALDLDSASDKEAAYNGYKAAKDSYMEQYETAKEKRLEAKSYIEDAEKFISDVASYAVKADSILPLTEKIPGIEDEDAKMLEDYEFADPKDFIIDLNAPREEKTSSRPTVSSDSGEEPKSSGKVDELPSDESENKALPASSEETKGPLADNSREGQKRIENADASTVDAK
nr:hypothetical protein [Treponema sp.]